VYGANLDPGTYRVTGYPSWNNTDGSAKTSKVITVTSEGWCLQAETVDGSGAAGAFGSCDGPVTATASLDIVLGAANVTGTVTTAELATVRDAYVSLSRVRTMNVDGHSWTTYEHLGGTPTNGLGEFALRVDASGTYLLEVNPPWQGTGSDGTRFTRTLTVTCASDVCTYTVEGDSSGAYGPDRALALWFVAPNVSGRVCAASSDSGACTGVENAWVSVESVNESDQPVQWIEGTSSRRNGTYRLSLSDGRYRITAHPSWQNPEGLPKSAICTVAGLVVTCESGTHSSGALDIKLASANVTGTLVYQVDGSGETPMAYGYVEVLTADGTWVRGAPADGDGAFGLALDPGIYTLRAWPNWSTAARPMIEVDLYVDQACGAVCWKYKADSSETSSPLKIDFDHVDPNVTVVIGAGPTDAVTGKRTVLVEEEVNGEFQARPALSGRSSGGETNSFTALLPAGTYRFTVLGALGETLASNVSDPVVVGGEPVTVLVIPAVTSTE
jgi:hypothetical protein